MKRKSFIFVKFSDYLLINKFTGEEDADKDGLNNLEELDWGTDPYDQDTDGDGMNDGAEVKAGRNPLGSGKIFKDLFIPHEGNNYHPHVLHPRRLAFHAVSAVAVKLILIGIIYLLPITAWLAPNVLNDQAGKIIDLTNQVRQRLGVNQLVESRLLDSAADGKAQDMLLKQYFAHVNPEGQGLGYWLKQVKYSFSVAGENLAMGFTEPQDIVDAWVKSPSHYKNLIDKDFKEIGIGMTSGNYQQTDTTFVAQYFGAPRIQATSTVAPAVPKAPLALESAPIQAIEIVQPVENIIQPVKSQASAQASEPDVLPEKIKEPLVVPAIIEPANGFITNKTEIRFALSHPGSEKYDLLINGSSVASSSNLTTNTTELYLTLPAGTHNFQLLVGRASEQSSSTVAALTIDNIAPFLEPSRSQVKTFAGADDMVFEVSAYLSPDTREARATVRSVTVALYPDPRDANLWSGRGTVYKAEQNQVEVPAEIVAYDYAGNVFFGDLAWQGQKPTPANVLSRYNFVRHNQSPAVGALFDFTGIYYKILLVIASFALLLNIFIEIKKQHHHVIASTVGFITLLLFLIVL